MRGHVIVGNGLTRYNEGKRGGTKEPLIKVWERKLRIERERVGID